MRGMFPTFLILMLVFAAPAVAADDPGLSLPDPDPVVESATSSTATQVESTQGFTRTVFTEAGQSVNDLQGLTVPASRVGAIFNATGDYGVATIHNGQSLVLTTTAWSAAEVTQKVDEVEAVLAAGDAIGRAGVDAVNAITTSLLMALCSAPVDPTACQEGSVVGAVEDEVERLLQRGSDEAGEDRFTETQEAAMALVGTVLPPL